jgi:hypothetical protein
MREIVDALSRTIWSGQSDRPKQLRSDRLRSRRTDACSGPARQAPENPNVESRCDAVGVGRGISVTEPRFHTPLIKLDMQFSRIQLSDNAAYMALTHTLAHERLAAAFPILVQGRRPHWTFRGLLNVHSRYGLPARCIAKATHLSRRLRRFRYLRRSDSYRLERPSCRMGIAPIEDQHLCTAHTTCVPVSLPGSRSG